MIVTINVTMSVTKQEGVDVLPGRQDEDIERQVMMEDWIAGPEGHSVERAGRRSTRTRGREADDHGDETESASPARRSHRPAVSCTGSTTSTPSRGRYLGAKREAISIFP